MTKEEITIEMAVSKEDFVEMAKTEPVRAAEALELELSNFKHWMEKQGMDRLTRVETQILREYLGFKLTQ
jgi:site-specific recombinase XerD